MGLLPNGKYQKNKNKPEIQALNFLVSLGLFSRFVKKQAWPHYILGTDSLLSVISKKTSFTQQMLTLTHDAGLKVENFSLYKIVSTQNSIKMKLIATHPSLKEVLTIFSKTNKDEIICKFLNPNARPLRQHIESLNFSVKDFLEQDEELRWLWPAWQRFQIDKLHI